MVEVTKTPEVFLVFLIVGNGLTKGIKPMIGGVL